VTDPIAVAARALSGRGDILVFTGAGISTESGIPDFRGPEGLWTLMDPAEWTIERYVESAETRKASWRRRVGGRRAEHEPNDGHRAITALWRSGRSVGCITQNIDGLHRRAGLPAEALVELHGNTDETVCLACGAVFPTDAVAARVEAGEDDPSCEVCGGILKVSVVLFGEPLPVTELMRARDMADRAEAVIAAGSTLSVFPASQFPLDVAMRGKPFIIVNVGDTDLDDLATVVIAEPTGTALPRLVAALGIERAD
jgi:NAD-dependent deacetylase